MTESALKCNENRDFKGSCAAGCLLSHNKRRREAWMQCQNISNKTDHQQNSYDQVTITRITFYMCPRALD